MSALHSRDAILRDFLKEKSLQPGRLADLMANRVFALTAAMRAVNEARQDGAEGGPDDIAASAITNLLNRTAELVSGAIVAEVTGLFPPSELLSRSALEYTAKALYMMQGDPGERVSGYLHAYPASVEKGLSKWKAECSMLTGSERQENLDAINMMENGNEARKELVKMLAPSEQSFPKTAHQVFLEAGLALEYRTLYWRLSSQTHGDAEDTINYLGVLMLNQLGDFEAIEVAVTETVVFTRWYAHMVTQVFLRACQNFHHNCMGSSNENLEEAQELIHRDTAAFARWMSKPSKEFPWIGNAELGASGA